jgi:hypothetical protein
VMAGMMIAMSNLPKKLSNESNIPRDWVFISIISPIRTSLLFALEMTQSLGHLKF